MKYKFIKLEFTLIFIKFYLCFIKVDSVTTSRYLMQVQMNILTDARCRQKFLPYSIDSYTQLCAGETSGNRDTCKVTYRNLYFQLFNFK